MKYVVKPSKQFKKDIKRMEKQQKNLSLLSDVVKRLASGFPLPEKFCDHALSGAFSGCRECHIQPDWLLIYETDENTLYLYLTRTGSHSELFRK